MRLYGDVVVPCLTHLSMRNRRLLPYRKRAIELARDRVLEIGAGSGLNLPLYRESVREVLALEPSPRLAGVRRWQDRLNPAWRRLSGGCNLNRPIQNLIEQGGFAIDRLETGYMPGPKLFTFIYEGSARPR